MLLRENALDVLALTVMAEALQFYFCEALYCWLWSVSEYGGLRPNANSYRCVSIQYMQKYYQKGDLFQIFTHMVMHDFVDYC